MGKNMLFTFHHVSIKTGIRQIPYVNGTHSHSTMYLLKQYIALFRVVNEIYSHSTMYLLKPGSTALVRVTISIFTFHHVSIKTKHVYAYEYKTPKFTFHHVSIKTNSGGVHVETIADSHSTMYLLKQRKI